MTKTPERTPQGSASAERRLDSWKEIASFLGRGIRTVQRWEREEGLPVHRLAHAQRGSVFADPKELSAWWESRQIKPDAEAGRRARHCQCAASPARHEHDGGDVVARAVVGRAHGRVRLGWRERMAQRRRCGCSRLVVRRCS